VIPFALAQRTTAKGNRPATTITVANGNDSGPGSLRQALADANNSHGYCYNHGKTFSYAETRSNAPVASHAPTASLASMDENKRIPPLVKT
jgi:hypothetical protein